MQPFEVDRGSETRSLRPKQVSRGYVLSLLALVLGLGIAAVVGLLLAFSDSTADPTTTVHRAREILVAEMKGQRPVLESTYIFTQTMIETSQQIYHSLKDPAPEDHVLVLLGDAAEYELATHSELELLHVRRNCDRDHLYADLLHSFEVRMLQAKIPLRVMDALHYQSPRLQRSCSPEGLVKRGLFSLREGKGRLLLNCGMFAGNKDLFHEVVGNISQTLSLRVADAVRDPNWLGAQARFKLSKKTEWSILDVMSFDIYSYEFQVTFKKHVLGFNIHISTIPWDINDYIFLPLYNAVLLQAMLKGGCPKRKDFSDAALPLRQPTVLLMIHCLHDEHSFTSNFTDKVVFGLNAAQRTRVLAQASIGIGNNKVCFGCDQSGVYNVPAPDRRRIIDAFEVAECIFRSFMLGDFPPDHCH